MSVNFKNVTVAGSGVLGSQIAYQTAFKGFTVSVYDIHEEAVKAAKERVAKLMPRYEKDLSATKEEVEAAFDRITFYSDLQEAVKSADLVIEAVPEVAKIKMEFYTKLGKAAPKHTVFATNSSTLLPSQFAEATGRPEKFLALHFANDIWKNNTAEVMKHPGTDEEIFNAVIEFAKAIDMVPLALHKEQPGYILNSLLVPFLEAGQKLLLHGIADPATIDKTWMIAMKSSIGPFGILDKVGITTAYNIAFAKGERGFEEYIRLAELLKTEYIDKGKLGAATGEGFYKYPNPAYRDPDFLKN